MNKAINFKDLKTLTQQKYFSIGTVYCPALDSDVVFNADGWHHLRYDSSRKERHKNVQKNKFIFLDDAVKMIKKSTTIQEYRKGLEKNFKVDKSGFCKTILIEWYGLLVITSIKRKIRINIVIKKNGENGKYIFWSVMPFWKLSNNQRVIGSKEIENI